LSKLTTLFFVTFSFFAIADHTQQSETIERQQQKETIKRRQQRKTIERRQQKEMIERRQQKETIERQQQKKTIERQLQKKTIEQQLQRKIIEQQQQTIQQERLNILFRVNRKKSQRQREKNASSEIKEIFDFVIKFLEKNTY
jgi:glucan-binding YG repeat protein